MFIRHCLMSILTLALHCIFLSTISVFPTATSCVQCAGGNSRYGETGRWYEAGRQQSGAVHPWRQSPRPHGQSEPGRVPTTSSHTYWEWRGEHQGYHGEKQHHVRHCLSFSSCMGSFRRWENFNDSLYLLQCTCMCTWYFGCCIHNYNLASYCTWHEWLF